MNIPIRYLSGYFEKGFFHWGKNKYKYYYDKIKKDYFITI